MTCPDYSQIDYSQEYRTVKRMVKEAEQIVSRLLDELQRLRKAGSITHETLAKETGVHPSTISLLESKKRTPTILTCLKLCQALGVRLEDVIRRVR